MNLQNFFNPKNIAVIGASSDKKKVGYAIMSNLVSESVQCADISSKGLIQDQIQDEVENEVKKQIQNQFQRQIFPVSISESEILGRKTYKSVKDIECDIDLAVIAVRSDIVPSILEECGNKGIKSAIIISAGFREIGPAGMELEERCAKIANEKGIALLGPNCLGTIDLRANFNCSFSAQNPEKGNIAFLSQSGALGTAILDMAVREGVGFSKFISLGNEARLSEIEFLEYLAKDEDTKTILIYLEKLGDGKKFLELASEITKTKPMVILKAGRGEKGRAAVASHTGSLAPEDAIFTAACKQAGVITVESIREFFNIAKLFQMGILKPLANFTILTNGGGPSVVTADLIDFSKSLSLTEFPDSIKEALRKVLPPMAAVGNPVDIIGDALADRYEEALKILCEEKDTDAIIMILTPQMMTEAEATAKLLIKYRAEKTIIPVFMGGPVIMPATEYFKQHGLVNFNFPEDAVEALDKLWINPPKRKNTANVARENKVSMSMMDFASMSRILKDFELSISGILVKEKNHIINAISKIGKGPYAMKIISADIVHKTDAGAVLLNVKSVEEAQKAWDSMHEKIRKNIPEAKIEGVSIQEMGRGREVIIGMKRDAIFGPVVLFGLGGIFTEVLKDVSMRVAPVSLEMAERMITEIKGSDILTGVRGEKSVDIQSLVDIIVKISKLSLWHSEIKEIDLNPVMVTQDGAIIVDARMMM